jgi:hypothetical protein
MSLIMMPFVLGRRQRNNVPIMHEGLCLIFVTCLMIILCFMFFVIVGDRCYLCQLSRQQIWILFKSLALGGWVVGDGHLYSRDWREVGLGISLGVGGYNFCWVFLGHVNVFGWVLRVVGASTHPLQRAMPIRAGVQFLIALGVTLTLCSVESCRLANLSLGCSNFQGTILQCSNFQGKNMQTWKLEHPRLYKGTFVCGHNAQSHRKKKH